MGKYPTFIINFFIRGKKAFDLNTYYG